MEIPFLDLKTQFKQIKEEIMAMMTTAMENAAFIGGSNVTKFEEEFAAFCNAEYCVGVGSGTDALRFALLAADIGSKDEIITVPNTFIATTEAISQVGATPVFVDIDSDTYNIDPLKIEEKITSKTKAILPVHLYGQPADMDAIVQIAKKYDLIIIEDACQAHGALHNSEKAGSIGDAGCFSFYPGKNLGAFGEAGAVITANKEIADSIRKLRDHGQQKKYFHSIEGYNGRIDAIQAGVLRIKLKYLAERNEARRKNAHLYNNLLAGVEGVKLPKQAEFAKSVYHLYVIQVDNRDGLQSYLGEKGIGTGLHYPMPLHLQDAYNHLEHKKGDFPICEKMAERLISLPMFPELNKDQIEYTVNAIKSFVAK